MNKTKNKIIGAIYTVVTALLLLIGNSCVVLVDKSISGNGIVETQSFPRRNFDAVSVDGDWTVDIRYSETFSVIVDADKNLFPYLDIYVSDNILHIGFQRGYVIGHTHCKAFITMPVLTQLTTSGSLTGTVSSFNMRRGTMSIVLSGSGGVTARDIIVKELDLKISGSGTFAATGKALNMTADISGSGNIEATGLEADNADISISGSGLARVWVRNYLKVDISGSGSVLYKGNPVVLKKVYDMGA